MAFLVPEYEKGKFAIGELAGETFVVPAKRVEEIPWDEDPEIASGWFCRLRSDEVSSCWVGPHDSRQDAMDHVEAEYEIDPNTGEDLEDDEDEEEAA